MIQIDLITFLIFRKTNKKNYQRQHKKKTWSFLRISKNTSENVISSPDINFLLVYIGHNIFKNVSKLIHLPILCILHRRSE